MITQGESQMQSSGDSFMRVVEALKILEDLKDMLADKSALINEIITSK